MQCTHRQDHILLTTLWNIIWINKHTISAKGQLWHRPAALEARKNVQRPLQKCSAPVPKQLWEARRSCQMLPKDCRDRGRQRRCWHLAQWRSSSPYFHPSLCPSCCTSTLQTCPSVLAAVSCASANCWPLSANAVVCPKPAASCPRILSAARDWWQGRCWLAVRQVSFTHGVPFFCIEWAEMFSQTGLWNSLI